MVSLIKLPDDPLLIPQTLQVVPETLMREQAVFSLRDALRNGSRETARPITGACNLAFLGLALSGLFLWWPRTWSRPAVRAVTVFDPRLRGKPRDFNCHNVIGFWCA